MQGKEKRKGKYTCRSKTFQEKDVDQYFLRSEKIAHNLKWPLEYRTMQLESHFIGKARTVYTQLSAEIQQMGEVKI